MLHRSYLSSFFEKNLVFWKKTSFSLFLFWLALTIGYKHLFQIIVILILRLTLMIHGMCAAASKHGVTVTLRLLDQFAFNIDSWKMPHAGMLFRWSYIVSLWVRLRQDFVGKNMPAFMRRIQSTTLEISTWFIAWVLFGFHPLCAICVLQYCYLKSRVLLHGAFKAPVVRLKMSHLLYSYSKWLHSIAIYKKHC